MAAFYDVLGVPPSAAVSELRTAFRRRALLVHPDKGGSNDAFRQVMIAFETLADPVRRERYDRRVLQHSDRHRGACADDGECKSHPDLVRTNKRLRARSTLPSNIDDGLVQRGASKSNGATACPRDRTHISAREVDLCALFGLLKRLPPSCRRRVLFQRFVQSERLALERWGKAHQAQMAKRDQSQDSAGVFQIASLGEKYAAVHVDIDDFDDTSCVASEASLFELADGHERADSAVESDESSFGEHHLRPSQPSLEYIRSSFASDAKTSPQKIATPAGGTQHRTGLYTIKKPGSGTCYEACTCISFVVLYSRRVRELATAIDYHLVLTEISQQVKASRSLEFAGALAKVLSQHGDAVKKMDLGIKFHLSKGYWLGRFRLTSPSYHCIETAISAIRRLHGYANLAGHRGVLMLRKQSPSDLQKHWEEFKLEYLNICEEGGWVRSDVQMRLEEQEALHEPHRERVLEHWNRGVMHREDIRANRLRYASCGDRRGATATTRERRICTILDRWRRREARVRLRINIRVRKEQQRALRRERQRARSKDESNDHGGKRREYGCKPYRDLTMAEILAGR